MTDSVHILNRILEAQAAQTVFLEKVDSGLHLLLDGLNALNQRIGAIETELTKEPPPSKAAEVLTELVEAVDHVGAQLAELTDAVRNSLSADEEEAESEEWDDQAPPEHGKIS